MIAEFGACGNLPLAFRTNDHSTCDGGAGAVYHDSFSTGHNAALNYLEDFSRKFLLFKGSHSRCYCQRPCEEQTYGSGADFI